MFLRFLSLPFRLVSVVLFAFALMFDAAACLLCRRKSVLRECLEDFL